MLFLTKAEKETRATKDPELCRLNDSLLSALTKTAVNPDGFTTTLDSSSLLWRLLLLKFRRDNDAFVGSRKTRLYHLTVAMNSFRPEVKQRHYSREQSKSLDLARLP